VRTAERVFNDLVPRGQFLASVCFLALPYRHAIIPPYDLALYISVPRIGVLQNLFTRARLFFWVSTKVAGVQCYLVMTYLHTYTRSAIIFGELWMETMVLQRSRPMRDEKG
jgi:hypothetical protein